eukprot:UN00102
MLLTTRNINMSYYYQLPILKPLSIQTKPIFEVVIECKNILHTPLLYMALQTLDLIDPNITVGITDRGECYISASGELHLERCIKDLEDWLQIIQTNQQKQEDDELQNATTNNDDQADALYQAVESKKQDPVELLVHPPTVLFRETIVTDYNLATNNPRQIYNLIHQLKTQPLTKQKAKELVSLYRQVLKQDDVLNYDLLIKQLNDIEAKLLLKKTFDLTDEDLLLNNLLQIDNSLGNNNSNNEDDDNNNNNSKDENKDNNDIDDEGNDDNNNTNNNNTEEKKHDIEKIQKQIDATIKKYKHNTWSRNHLYRLNTPSNNVQLRLQAISLP